eukprot:3047597-Pyramimonas_sp.AAC.2
MNKILFHFAEVGPFLGCPGLNLQLSPANNSVVNASVPGDGRPVPPSRDRAQSFLLAAIALISGIAAAPYTVEGTYEQAAWRNESEG